MFAAEGKSILNILGLITGLSALLSYYFSNSVLLFLIFAIVMILFLFSLNFFRDPVRTVPSNPQAVVSPADGKIVKIEKINDPETGQDATLISIFLNVFNVHANRMPISGEFKSVLHRNGKFLAAFDHAASEVNEQTIIIIKNKYGTFKVKQIAGLIARRILCYAEAGKEMQKGDRLGYIMFGSRTDLILPSNINVQVKLGQKVCGTQTVIGEIS